MPSKRILLRLFYSSSSLLGLTAIALASLAMLLQQRKYEQDAQANDYLFQVPLTIRNGTANQLDQLLSELGLGRTDGHVERSDQKAFQVQLEANQQFERVKPAIELYLKQQRNQSQAGLMDLPLELRDYLALAEQRSLPQVQTFLLDSPLPSWDAQSDITQAATLNFFPIAFLQRLLLLKGIAHQQDGQAQEMAQSFEAAWRLTEAIAVRSDLLSQMMAGILQQQQLTLLRHLDLQPEAWQARLQKDQQQTILHTLTFDSWSEYQSSRKDVSNQFSADPRSAGLQRSISQTLGQIYLQFSRSDWRQARQRSQAALAQQSLCDVSTTPEAFKVIPHRLNAFGHAGASHFAREWIKAGDRMLAAELTHHVLQLRKQAKQQGQWPEQLQATQSQVCPGVAWQYERQADGSIDLWLEQPAHWRIGLSGEFLPLRYQSAPYEQPVAAGQAALLRQDES